jgi:nucleoside-diphosphate-sugar epimerase
MEGEKNLKVLVYGGTGSQASPTVTHLLERGHTPHVVTRNHDRVAELETAGAVPVVGDLGDFDCLCAASSEVDAVAFLLPAFLEDPQDGVKFGRHAIDAASQAGVSFFVWNTSGEVSDDDRRRHCRTCYSNRPPTWKTGWAHGPHPR